MIIFWFRSAAADCATGVATLAKLLNPKIKVIGVEPAGANCMQESLKEGKVVDSPERQHHRGLVLQSNAPASKLFPYIQQQCG